MNIKSFCDKFAVLTELKTEIEALETRCNTAEKQLAELNETIKKSGYKVEAVEGSTGTFVLVKDESDVDDADGTPFKPYTYTKGMSVEQGKWYRTDEYIWECIKSGVPDSFEDTEYFEVIE